MYSAFNLLVGALGVYITYKALTEIQNPEVEEPVEIADGFGDDAYTHIQGLHAENRLGPITTTEVSDGLNHSVINGALFETNPEQLQPPHFDMPRTMYVRDFA